MRYSTPRGVRRTGFLLAAAAILLARPASAQKETLLRDQWQVMRMFGQPAGYSHVTVRQAEDATGVVFVTRETSQVSVRRGGAGLELLTGATMKERPDGTLVSMVYTMKMSSQETKVAATFSDGKAHLTTTVMGKSRNYDVDCPKDTVGPHKLDELSKAKLRKAGDTLDAVTFTPDTQTATKIHVVVEGPEATKVYDGTSKTLLKATKSIDAYPAPFTEWLDEKGDVQKMRISMGGIPVELFTATRGEALKAAGAKTELPPDIFNKSLVHAKHVIPHPRHLESALLKITPKSKDLNLEQLATDRQTIEKTAADGSILLRSVRKVPAEGKTGVRPMKGPPAELAQYLQPNSMIQSDAKEIEALAQKVVGDETDAWAAAKKLESFVHGYITAKDFNVGFASALEVCRNREGDCTEHAVLLCALCRAAGIPSRIATGLEYIAGVWGGHAWTEVYVAGDWYAIDGTNAYGFVDPLHLTLTTASLKDGSFAKEFMKGLDLLGNIDLEVQQVTYGGKVFDLTAEKTAWGGTHFSNAGWGVSFDAPKGAKIVKPRYRPAMNFDLARVAGKDFHATIAVMDRPADRTLDSILHGAKAEALKVDGQPARICDRGAGKEILIFAGDTMVLIRCEGSDADREAFLNSFHLGNDR